MPKRPLSISYVFFLSAFFRRYLAYPIRFYLRRCIGTHGDPGQEPQSGWGNHGLVDDHGHRLVSNGLAGQEDHRRPAAGGETRR